MKFLSLRFAINLIIAGLIVVAISLILLIPFRTYFIASPIDNELIGQFGDFIGGIAGSLWALAGVIMFYVALHEQKEDFKTNREILSAQLEEFKLQQVELAETRKVFKEQSKTLKLQRFESSFFQLLNFRNESLNSLSVKIITKHPPTTGYKVLEEISKMIDNRIEKFVLNGLYFSFNECFIDSYSTTVPQNEKEAIQYLVSILEDVFSDYESYFIHYYRTTHQAIIFALRADDYQDRLFYLETILNSMSQRTLSLFIFITFYKRNEFSKSLEVLKTHNLLSREQITEYKNYLFLDDILKNYLGNLSYNEG
jgi:hypothetical protein